MLLIAPERLSAGVRDEEFEKSGLFFPHIYGPLNLDVVGRVVDFVPGVGGTFELPDPV